MQNVKITVHSGDRQLPDLAHGLQFAKPCSITMNTGKNHLNIFECVAPPH